MPSIIRVWPIRVVHHDFWVFPPRAIRARGSRTARAETALGFDSCRVSEVIPRLRTPMLHMLHTALCGSMDARQCTLEPRTSHRLRKRCNSSSHRTFPTLMALIGVTEMRRPLSETETSLPPPAFSVFQKPVPLQSQRLRVPPADRIPVGGSLTSPRQPAGLAFTAGFALI